MSEIRAYNFLVVSDRPPPYQLGIRSFFAFTSLRNAVCGITEEIQRIVESRMQFEWNETTNLENIRKHEIDFADVFEVLASSRLVELCDRFDYGEDRWLGIGFLAQGVAVIVWTERQNDGIRLISARRANRYERQRFKQYLSN